MKGYKRIWQAWKRFGQLMGDLVARIALTLLYFTIFLPFGLLVRFLMDPLLIKQNDASWQPRDESETSLAAARRLS